MATFKFDAIGTKWQIDIYSDFSGDKLMVVKEKLLDRFEEYDAIYSRFKKGSFIRRLSEKRGKYPMPYDGKVLFDLYSDLYKITRGRFTPFIGQVLSDAGYDEGYSFVNNEIGKPLNWADALEYTSSYLIVHEPSLLDFGAAGKGYLVDIASDMLVNFGIDSFCVDGSGDIRYENKNNKFLRIGLENPEDKTQIIGVANILNKSICASAGNRRKWGKYHHIIDPSTLESPKDIIAVWVIADKTILADAISTCLFLVEPDLLLTKFKFEYTILYKDFSLRQSEGFGGEMFLKA